MFYQEGVLCQERGALSGGGNVSRGAMSGGRILFKGGREMRGVDVSGGGVEVEACCWVYIPRSNAMFNIIYTI